MGLPLAGLGLMAALASRSRSLTTVSRTHLGISLSAWLQAIIITLVLLLLPLVYGGVYNISRALTTLAIMLTAVLSVAPRIISGRYWDGAERAWVWPWLAVTALIAVHLLPLPAGWLHYVSAYPDEILREPGLSVLRQISPSPAVSLGYWAMFTTYWITAYLVAQLPRPQLRLVILALVGIVAFEAVYGLIAHLGRHETILGVLPARENHSLVLGTYYNRNHIAGLLALGWPVGMAFLLYGTNESSRLRVREVRYFWLVAFSAAVALALFNTQSRLGSFAGLLGVLIFYLLLRYDRQRERLSFLQRFWLWTAGGVALILAVWFGLGPLLGRYTTLLLEGDVGRLQAWQTVFDLPAKSWLLGVGAGGFEEVFKLVQPGELRLTFVHLHNDWLQFVLEFGLIGSVLVLIALWYAWQAAKPTRFGGLRAGVLGGIAAIAFHSLGDFNLQIPGTAFAFWVAVGIFCNRHLLRSSRHARKH